ncbi:MAG TPA: nitroreductase [Micromonosporaceae bacterium]|nr:nitroreductase [Micromonosporaceae bacterium]
MTTDRGSVESRSPASALAEAVAAAVSAPSVHNTQPWRWRLHPTALDLYAERSRQLPAADPQGRLLVMSCGAALHHVRTALAAEGWLASVSRFPDPADPDHLARVTVTDRSGVMAEAMRLFQTIGMRRTDRRPLVDEPLPPSALDAVRRAAAAEGTDLHRVTEEQLSDLAVAAAHANEIGLADPDQRAELAYWVGGQRAEGTGVPDPVLPSSVPQTDVPERDFGHAGTLRVGAGHDRAATYALLFGRGDEPSDWLRAGEALSACWLTATELGVSVLPLSSVVEVPATRQALRRILSGLGYPYIVLRLGAADPDEPGPPHTPRLSLAEILDVSEVRPGGQGGSG